VSTLDVVPTVARLLGLRPAAGWQGQVLSDMLER
jgi:arylsulfatase A-like enzyme